MVSSKKLSPNYIKIENEISRKQVSVENQYQNVFQ